MVGCGYCHRLLAIHPCPLLYKGTLFRLTSKESIMLFMLYEIVDNTANKSTSNSIHRMQSGVFYSVKIVL